MLYQIKVLHIILKEDLHDVTLQPQHRTSFCSLPTCLSALPSSFPSFLSFGLIVPDYHLRAAQWPPPSLPPRDPLSYRNHRWSARPPGRPAGLAAQLMVFSGVGSERGSERAERTDGQSERAGYLQMGKRRGSKGERESLIHRFKLIGALVESASQTLLSQIPAYVLWRL